MEYIKVPYILLKGKKFGGNLSQKEQDEIQHNVNIDDGVSVVYDGTFQELYKAYKNGEDPAKDATHGVIGGISDPEKMLDIHNAISTVAKKYGYKAPDQKLLPGISKENYRNLLTPNSYFISKYANGGETVLVITDKDLNINYVVLPIDIDYSLAVDADQYGNVLIPKEAYDKDLEIN